jgi:hypothetical protein
MTIEECLDIADPNGVFSYTMRNQLRDAILALLDAEAEECAQVCDAQGREWDSDAQQTLKNYAAFSAEAIRARIAARKGGAQP